MDPLLRQLLESMLQFFEHGSSVTGGSLLTDSDLTTEEIVRETLKRKK